MALNTEEKCLGTVCRQKARVSPRVLHTRARYFQCTVTNSKDAVVLVKCAAVFCKTITRTLDGNELSWPHPLSGARELRYNSTEDVRVCFGDETGTVWDLVCAFGGVGLKIEMKPSYRNIKIFALLSSWNDSPLSPQMTKCPSQSGLLRFSFNDH